MYVKWRRYKLSGHIGYSLRAEAVETYRDPVTGKPKARYIGYLGSVRESQLNDGRDDLAALCFWECVNVRLDRLSLSPEEKEAIREKVSERIPCQKCYIKSDSDSLNLL